MSTDNGHCQGTKKDGSSCQSPATANGWCFWHDPDRSVDEKHAAAMRGGLVHKRKALPASAQAIILSSPEAAVAALERNADATAKGELDPRIANSVAYQIRVAIDAWTVMISDKLDRLERTINGKVRRR
jgi:hypothetical protein